MNILILILVAIIITNITTKGKQIVDYIAKIFTKKKVKSSLPIAVALGILAGVTLQIGFAQSILELFGTEVELSDAFKKVDIGFACAMLGYGSGKIIRVIETYSGEITKIAKK